MAVRTNSKEAKLGIREYIRQCYPDDWDDGYDTEFPVMAHRIMGRFNDWCTGRRPTYNMQEYFEEYCMECPDTNIGDFYLRTYDNAIDIVGEILGETEEERNKYPLEKAEHLLTSLMYRELLKGVKEYDRNH